MILFRVSNHNAVVYAVALDREDAKRAARQELGMNPDRYTVEPISPNEEWIQIVHNFSNPRVERFETRGSITWEQIS
jgi:hypothetical protein